jgi:beta-mannosidase
VPGEESPGISNRRHSTVRKVHLYTVCDAPAAQRGTLLWDLFHLDGRRMLRGRKRVALRPGESVKQTTLDLAVPLAEHGRDALYLRLALEIAGRRVSEETVFFAPPRFLALPRARTAVGIHLTSPTRATLTFRSLVFQHRFAFDLPGLAHCSSDNYFELYPWEKKTIEVEFARPQTPARLKRLLTFQSLVDTY